MKTVLHVVCAVAIFFAWANGDAVLHDAECGGTPGKYCDVTKGLFCEKKWTSCASSTGVCMCKPDTIWSDDDEKCKTEIAKDDDCTASDSKCTPPYVCESGTCACPADTTYNQHYSGLCLSDDKKVFDGVCANNDDCESGLCTNQKCACPAGYNQANGFCQKPVHDETCVVNDDECQGTNIECTGGTPKCACTAGNTVWDDKTKGCKADDGAVDAGANCTSDDDCSGTVNQCLACGKGTADTAKKCREADSVADIVHTAIGGYLKECEGLTGNGCDETKGLKCKKSFSDCKIGICNCDSGYTWESNKCQKVLDKNGNCAAADTKCAGDMTCKDDKCACGDDETYDADYSTKCRPNDKKVLGEECSDDAGCESGTCTDDKCACPAGQDGFGSKYCRQPMIGEDCTDDSTCQDSGTTVECSNGKCACSDSDYEPLALKSLGCKAVGNKEVDDECADINECADNDVVCAPCSVTENTKKCRKPESGNGNGNGNENAAYKMSISTVLFISACLFQATFF